MNLQPLVGKDASGIVARNGNASAPSKIDSFVKPKSGATTAWIAAMLLIIYFAGRFFTEGWDMVVITLALIVILVALGKAIVGRPLGILINEQNIMSLSRFQLVVWTVIVIGAYFAYSLARIRNADGDPLNIKIDYHLLALMGISAASFIASPLILGTKKDKVPDQDVVAKTAPLSGDSVAEVEDNRQGLLYANTNIGDARVTDMFQGDELGNTTHIDLAKVQMFFFTVIAAMAYFVLVFESLRAEKLNLGELPILSDGIVAMLGISHASYLGSKGIDHTPIAK
jgi:hypothetical protein